MIKNFKLLIVSIFFFFIFLYDFDNGITDYLFLAASLFLFGFSFIQKKISDYLFIVATTTYSFLLIYSIFWSPTNKPENYFITDEILGYKLKPNISVTFNDNIRKGVIKTNSLGYRDDEFTSNSNPNIVLLGDSMTFGHKVDQKNNLDKQIEQLCGNVNAHNLGVGGYGLPGIIDSYKRYKFDHFHTIYFFYINDLREDNFTVHQNSFARDGYIIFNGKDKTSEEITEILNLTKKTEDSFSHIKLRYFFMALKNYLASIGLINLEKELNYFPFGGYSDDLTMKGIDLTIKLKELANSKKSDLTVVILPSVRSINAQGYPDQVQTYLENISSEVRVIDPLKKLTQSDYIYYDGHLSEKGMKKIAYEICDLLNNI